MLIIGLTGSIGMGKSTAAAHFKALGIGVFDADAAVHDLYRGAAVTLIEAAFPGTTAHGIVDRPALASALGTSAEAFARLEAIVHPLVRRAERAFLIEQANLRASFAVLEIPLLFETGADALVDTVIVVSTTADAQRARVLARPGMSVERLEAILARQMSDSEKRARADFVVDTGGPVADTQAQINQALMQLEDRTAVAFQRDWELA
jgi:dephospho-CoA kinase